MYLKTLLLTAIFLWSGNTFSQDQQLRKFDIDVAAHFHSFSSAQLQAVNSVTQLYNSGTKITNHDGYGSCVTAGFNFAWYFSDNVGVSLGFFGFHLENDLYVENEDAWENHENTMEQYHINPALSLRHSPDNGRTIFNMKTGLALVPFFIKQQYEYNDGSYYLDGDNGVIGPFTEIGIKLRIFKFLYLKTDIAYSFLKTDYRLNGEDMHIEYKNANLGGITLKTGLTFSFF
jgi:outer membrane protein W